MTTSDQDRHAPTSSATTSRKRRDPGPQPRQAFVWVWLPGATEPAVAGRLDVRATRSGGLVNDIRSTITFTYGTSYLARLDAISLYLPELPLRPGRQEPMAGLEIAGCIRDAGPDSWGQRVILARRTGIRGADADTGDLDQLTYLLDSGTNRIGGLDFQASATEYVPRVDTASLKDMMLAAESLEKGEPLPPELAEALNNGTSIGGAHPKALVEEEGKHLIAKFSRPGETYPWIKAEAIGMELGRRVGLFQVPDSRVIDVAGRDVLLIERFDRTGVTGQRRLMVSALTILGLHEQFGYYATYWELANRIRAEFAQPQAALRDLFSRIVFNICIGNIDDHARNHAAFWDGNQLRLTPAYDLTPQPRSGETADQALAISSTGARESRLQVCRDAAAEYNLTRADATDIIDHTKSTILSQWKEAADAVGLTPLERAHFWKRQILNPFVDYT